MTHEAVSLADPTLVPRGTKVALPPTQGRIITVQKRIFPRKFITKFLSFLVIIEIAFTVILTPSPSGMTGSAILDEGEGRFVNFRGMTIDLLGQLARVERSQSMLPVHTGGEVPRMFGIKGVTDDNSSHSIGSALLEVVTVCYLGISMANPTGLLGAIRHFTVHGEMSSIRSSQEDLFVLSGLRSNGRREKEEKASKNSERPWFELVQRPSLLMSIELKITVDYNIFEIQE